MKKLKDPKFHIVLGATSYIGSRYAGIRLYQGKTVFLTARDGKINKDNGKRENFENRIENKLIEIWGNQLIRKAIQENRLFILKMDANNSESIKLTISEINRIINSLSDSKTPENLDHRAIGIDNVISRMSMSKTLYNASRCLDETVYYKKNLLDNLSVNFENVRLELNEILTGFSIPTAIGAIDKKNNKRVSIEPTNPYEAMKVLGWMVVNHFFNSNNCPPLWKVNYNAPTIITGEGPDYGIEKGLSQLLEGIEKIPSLKNRMLKRKFFPMPFAGSIALDRIFIDDFMRNTRSFSREAKECFALHGTPKGNGHAVSIEHLLKTFAESIFFQNQNDEIIYISIPSIQKRKKLSKSWYSPFLRIISEISKGKSLHEAIDREIAYYMNHKLEASVLADYAISEMSHIRDKTVLSDYLDTHNEKKISITLPAESETLDVIDTIFQFLEKLPNETKRNVEIDIIKEKIESLFPEHRSLLTTRIMDVSEKNTVKSANGANNEFVNSFNAYNLKKRNLSPELRYISYFNSAKTSFIPENDQHTKFFCQTGENDSFYCKILSREELIEKFKSHVISEYPN